MRVIVAVFGLLFALTVAAFAADGENSTRPSAPTSPKKAQTDVSSERERMALEFVRDNHAELAKLLEQLKPMRPSEYNRAIREIANVSETLARLKDRDPKRYEMGLDLWKAKSRVELLTAKLVNGPNPSVESSLRDAVAHQFEIEIAVQKYERERAKALVKKYDETIERLESNQQKMIESRYQGFLKQSQRARRQDANKSVPAKPVPAKKGDSKA